MPHQSDHPFISAILPVLYPSSVHEFLGLGLLGIAMSRFSGCWVGFKVISETVETTAVVDLAPERREFVLPDFDLPPGGLSIRWPDPPLVQDERLQEHKGYAARADMGGGVVLTQCHSLDYLPWLVGNVESVWGFTAKLSDLEVDVEDTAKIGLRFASGALGSIHLDYNEQPPAHYFEVVGTQGSLQWNLSDGATRIYRAASPSPREASPKGAGRGARGEGAWESYPLPAGWERNFMFMEEMKHFVSVARGEAESSCPLEAGITVQRLIEAIHQSNKMRMAVTI